MARITKARLALARDFVQQYATLKNPACDVTGWLMLKFSCSRLVAARLVHAVERNAATEK